MTGATLLLDVNTAVPGLYYLANPSFVATAGNVVVFLATDASTGRELWKTDGTAEGTALVEDICPGLCTSLYSPATLTNYGILSGSLSAQPGVLDGTLSA